MEKELEKNIEKEIYKIETKELIEMYQKVEQFVDYLQKEQKYE